MKLKLFVALALVAVLSLMTTAIASAAGPYTYIVNAAFASDSGCTTTGLHCQTIGAAIAAASDGDTIVVAAGTYSVTQIVINKALTIVGGGLATTIIDGGSVTTLPNAGMVKITTSTGNVTFTGFTIRNAGTCGTCADDPNHPGWKVRIAFQVGSSASGVTYTISSNKILGANNPSDAADFGFYAQGGNETLVFKNNQVTQTGANPITLEKHSGASDVSFNTFDRGIGSGAVDAYFSMNYGGANVTTLQKVSYNTIDLGTGAGPYTSANRSTGISFAGNFTQVGVPGGYTNVQIVGNTISNLQDQRRGIGLWNASANAYGDISNTVITANTVAGLGRPGSKGIQLLNLITNATIQGNNINNVDYVFHGRSIGGSAPSGLTISSNSFSSATTGFVWDWAPTLNAPLNWWGCAAGPGNPGCIPVVGNVNVSPFARALTTSATASTHELGETGILTTSVTATGLYGAQLVVDHTISVLGFTSGISINVPSASPPWSWDIVPRNFTATSGRTELSGSMRRDAHPAGANLGGNAIAQWNYSCTAAGTSALTYNTTAQTGTILSDINGFQIPAALLGDSITCVPTTSASTSGIIGLQGRLAGAASPAGWNGAVVTLTCTTGACLGSGPYVFPASDIGGNYSIIKAGPGTGVATGTYSASVSRRAYLDSSKTGVVISSGSNVLSTPTLLGGNVVQDNTIDIGDLSNLGGAFGNTVTADTGADINGDGIVNILDLVLAGGNYGLNSPQPW